MSVMELEAKRMGIFRLLLNVENEKLLQEIEVLLYKDRPLDVNITREVMYNAVIRSQEDIRNGRVYTMEQMRAKHPRI